MLSCISDEVLSWSDSHEYESIARTASAAAEHLRPLEIVKSSNPIRASAIAFEKYIIYGGFKEIKAFELESGEPTTSITGNFGWVNHLSVVYGTTTLIVSAHDDGVIRTWDFFGDYASYAAQPTHELCGHSQRATCTAAVQGVAPLVVSGSMDGTLRVWDLELEQPVAFSFHRRGITCAVASVEEPQLIASGDENGEVIVWTLSYPALEVRQHKKGKDGAALPLGAERVKPSLKPAAAVRISDSPITCLRVLEKGEHVSERLLLIARQDGNVCIRRMADAELIYAVEASGSPVSGMSVIVTPGVFSHTPVPKSNLDDVIAAGKRVVLLTTCGESVRVWDVVRCELLGSCFGHIGDVLSLATTGKRVRRMRRPRGLGCRPDSIGSESVFSFTSMLQAAGMIKTGEGGCSSFYDGSTSSDDDDSDTGPDNCFVRRSSPVRSFSRDSSSPDIDCEIESVSSGGESMYSILSTGADGRMLSWELFV